MDINHQEEHLLERLRQSQEKGPDAIQEAAETVLKFSEKQNSKKLRRIAVNALGASHLMKQDFSPARKFFLEALQLSRDRQDAENEVGALSNLGLVHLMQSHYELALQAYLAILRKIKTENLNVSQAVTLNNLAIVHHYLEQYDEAAETYAQSAAIAESEKDHCEEGKTRLNLSQSLIRAQRLAEAETECQRARELLEDRAQGPVLATLEATFALLKLRQFNALEGLEHAKRGLAIMGAEAAPLERMGVLVTLGECHEQLKQVSEAESSYKEALELADALKRPRDAKECCEYLARMYHDHGREVEAVNYYQLALDRHKNLFNMESARMRSEAEVRHQTELALAEKKLLEAKNEELHKANLEICRQRDELQNMLDHVKTLRGLLPICASCKKIRDDEGYWTQIESYISSHSDAQFSHGLCPGCARKEFGEFFLEQE